MAHDWNAALYDRFGDERSRPARDLLLGISHPGPARVVDLGCGSGASTELCLARWPRADVLGLDTSEAMLEAARRRVPRARFARGDAASYAPDGARPDVLFANALLHWVQDHAALLPRLLAALTPGGVLAFQVPDNEDEPSHRLMREVAAQGPWAAALRGAAAERAPIAAGEEYHDLLTAAGASVTVWRTTYLHAFADASAIVDLFRSTGLGPYLARLSASDGERFLAAYGAAVAKAYPRREDGRVLLRFPRLFVVAARAG